MKEAKITLGPKVEIVDSQVPSPEAGQVLIKVVVSGSNPKDWKIAEWMPHLTPLNTGDDIAGTIEKVGDGVTDFKAGDRVAAFHEMMTSNGSFAEYAIAPAHTTFHLPEKTSFEEGAAVPLAALTAAMGLYAPGKLALPPPSAPAKQKIPLLVYGASSAVGSYALQLASLSNIHPLICVAGKAQKHVESLIDRSKGDTIIDYRSGDDALVEGLKKALDGQKLEYAFDAVSEKGSYVNIAAVLDPQGKCTLVLPPNGDWNGTYKELPSSVAQSQTNVGSVHDDQKELGQTYSKLFSKGLQDGSFRGHPQEVIPGGLGGVQTGLENLRDGKASAIKYVFRIAETEGLKSS